MSTAVQVEQVSQRFGSKTVLSEISLQVREAEIFGLLGPSGSGKTTLVRMIAGIDEPSSGYVSVLGYRMPQLSVMSEIGYMAQADALYSELTAQENLEFFAGLYGIRGQKLKAESAK